MSTEIDPTALGVNELVALIHELRRQLAERDLEIARLRSALPTQQEASPQEPQTEDSTGPAPGSQEDLLAQLEQLYPDGR